MKRSGNILVLYIIMFSRAWTLKLHKNLKMSNFALKGGFRLTVVNYILLTSLKGLWDFGGTRFQNCGLSLVTSLLLRFSMTELMLSDEILDINQYQPIYADMSIVLHVLYTVGELTWN